ncbi:MAG: LysM peptidoglycan-binding domain-containing protein [Verrucomicrobiota bacterium]|nr:LysM peptidoglycan-binding domain-containing protein [Verrucomicrobiota bacterium]
MNNPSPLIPQGSLLQKQGRGASNVRIAVATIVAVHLLFFGGLLMIGCKRDASKTGVGTASSETNTNLSLPNMETTNSAYYTSPTNLPGESFAYGTNPVVSSISTGTNSVISSNPYPVLDSGYSTNTPLTPTNQSIAETTPSVPSESMKEYTVVKNDTLSRIAKLHRVTIGAITRANPNIDPSRLKIGMKLQIPVSTASSTTTASDSSTSSNGKVYVVKAGDTLSRIAKTHGVTINAIRSANGMKTTRVLVGQKLKIPARNDGSSNSASTTNEAAPVNNGVSSF